MFWNVDPRYREVVARARLLEDHLEVRVHRAFLLDDESPLPSPERIALVWSRVRDGGVIRVGVHTNQPGDQMPRDMLARHSCSRRYAAFVLLLHSPRCRYSGQAHAVRQEISLRLQHT